MNRLKTFPKTFGSNCPCELKATERFEWAALRKRERRTNVHYVVKCAAHVCVKVRSHTKRCMLQASYQNLIIKRLAMDAVFFLLHFHCWNRNDSFQEFSVFSWITTWIHPFHSWIRNFYDTLWRYLKNWRTKTQAKHKMHKINFVKIRAARKVIARRASYFKRSNVFVTICDRQADIKKHTKRKTNKNCLV